MHEELVANMRLNQSAEVSGADRMASEVRKNAV